MGLLPTKSITRIASSSGLDGGMIRTATGAVAGIAATAGIAKGAAVIVDRGEVGIRHRFGKEKRYRFGSRKGQVVTIGPGVHFQVPLMHSIKKLKSNIITTELKDAAVFVPRSESDRESAIDDSVQIKLGASALWKLIDNTDTVYSPSHPRGKQRQFVYTSTQSTGSRGESSSEESDNQQSGIKKLASLIINRLAPPTEGLLTAQDPPIYRALYEVDHLHDTVAAVCLNGLINAFESFDSDSINDDELVFEATRENTAEELAKFGVELVGIAFNDRSPTPGDRQGTLVALGLTRHDSDDIRSAAAAADTTAADTTAADPAA